MPGGQQHAQRVARLGQHRLAVDEVGVALLLREPFLEVGLHRLVHAAVRGRTPRRGTRRSDRRAACRRVRAARWRATPAGPVVVAHVARRLLQVRGQPSPLQRLGQQLRGLLAREVHAAELGHRVVAVLDEDVLVEARGAFTADGGRRRGPQRRVSSANSSRNRRRSDFVVREYRANSAPFTASGRFTSAKTGPSRFVKCRSSMARSSGENSSVANVSVMVRGYPRTQTSPPPPGKIVTTEPASTVVPAAGSWPMMRARRSGSPGPTAAGRPPRPRARRPSGPCARRPSTGTRSRRRAR